MLVASQEADAQQTGKVPRIGILAMFSSSKLPVFDAFRQGLREQGYVEGQNIALEYRFAHGRAERFPALAAELVRIKVDVIVTESAPSELSGKRLQLLKEAAPKITLVAVIGNAANPATQDYLRETEATARSLSLPLQTVEVRSPADLEAAFKTVTGARPSALMTLNDAMLFENRKRVAEFSVNSRLPAIFPEREFAEAGGLMAYGPNLASNFHRAATFVDKILKGAKPADLPVEQPTRFELVINMKTAKALGLTIPPSILIRADKLIE